jgi:protein ImuA
MPETHPAAVAPDLVLAPDIALARARVHEATGPARVVFALAVAARLAGPVLWIRPAWTAERLMGDGISGFLAPARLILARGRTPTDLLWTAEEALRAGAAPLVVAELPVVPGLTATRRLHLAAGTGAAQAAHAKAVPLGLLLTPEPGGVPGIETRWRLAPAPGWAAGGDARWRLTRLRARMAPERTWEVARRGDRLVPVAPG